jgi:hypothetical protein
MPVGRPQEELGRATFYIKAETFKKLAGFVQGRDVQRVVIN